MKASDIRVNYDGEDEQYSPQDIDNQVYSNAQAGPSRVEDDVDYDDQFETLAAKKRKTAKISRIKANESGIADEDLSELEDDDPKAYKKKHKSGGRGQDGPKKSKKKRAHELEDEADAVAMRIQAKMVDAYNADAREFEQGNPGLYRFALLPEIVSVMSKAYNQNSLLEVGILQEVRLFLEPHPDGTLPIINIQRDLLLILAQMPITIEMLRSSYIGRIVKFYASCDRITQEVQKLADQLMSRWTNMVNRTSQAAASRRLGTGPPKKRIEPPVDKSKQPDVQKRLMTTMTKLKLSNRKR
ncbi:Transcription factor iws1 [Entomophthora muscae]|uniref:Transcription factor iws1 n=1 Tax=Entomophthora muscae TaxID=34485 RepID=A0ACC2UFZ4_9FUNG|nr:Transcription factor iws1 [Entomophthora muscae]